MKYFFILVFISIISFMFWLSDQKSEDCEIFALTYSSMTQSWGAGPILAKEFKSETECQVHWVDAGDAHLIVKHLELANSSDRQIDLVLGLDQFLISEAQKVSEFHKLNKSVSTQFEWNSDEFLPVDWSPMSFVSKQPLKYENLEDALDKIGRKLVLMDPRTSSPGMQFAHWYINEFPKIESFELLKARAQAIVPSWSLGYKMFTSGQTPVAFTYITSPVYHWIEEDDESVQIVELNQPLPYQLETVAIPKTAKNTKTAIEFVEFLLSERGQKTLMEKNYMLPVRESVIKGTMFERVPKVDLIPGYHLNVKTKKILKLWDSN